MGKKVFLCHVFVKLQGNGLERVELIATVVLPKSKRGSALKSQVPAKDSTVQIYSYSVYGQLLKKNSSH